MIEQKKNLFLKLIDPKDETTSSSAFLYIVGGLSCIFVGLAICLYAMIVSRPIQSGIGELIIGLFLCAVGGRGVVSIANMKTRIADIVANKGQSSTETTKSSTETTKTENKNASTTA